jgi:hypothetical protein
MPHRGQETVIRVFAPVALAGYTAAHFSWASTDGTVSPPNCRLAGAIAQTTNPSTDRNYQDGPGPCVKTRCTTLVPMPSFRPILRILSPFAFSSNIRASTAGFTWRRPSLVPFALARARPALTRSRIIPRSNSQIHPTSETPPCRQSSRSSPCCKQARQSCGSGSCP